jgi:hypothetical protein
MKLSDPGGEREPEARARARPKPSLALLETAHPSGRK